MIELQKAFEEWARENIGQFSPRGHYGAHGVWFYDHLIQDSHWRCWQACAVVFARQINALNGAE